MKRVGLLLLTFTLTSMLSACGGIEPVAAWERGYLADPAMTWDASPSEAQLKNHVYSSKEASAGGNGAAGGGCGCN